ncbi:hypothetical protein EV192_10792 [Actinocrispum wychmicini]|uniref:Uncharacterized protein n=1 Tax=Actinocrispum wychmicini TaxID=1213861 RepID=A0A4V2S6D8_9PSEU|nr:hypothetical protein EV192_10792 [Actinocrispum wychmicini]
MHGCFITDRELVVSGGHGTVALEPIDPALHRVALLVDVRVEGRWPATGLSPVLAMAYLITLLRDRAPNTPTTQIGTVRARPIRLVGQHPIRPRARPTTAHPHHPNPPQHHPKLGRVTPLPRSHHHRQRLLPLFHRQMHLGGPPTPRPPQPVISRFGLADPTRRLLLVPTIGPRTRGMLMRPIDRGIHTHIPDDQPSRIGLRLQPGDDQHPHPGSLPTPKQPIHGLPAAVSGGTSLQGDPTRIRHRIPSINCRLVHFGGRPGFFPTGSSGSSTAHCASVRSARPVAATLATRSPVCVIVLVDDRSTGDLVYLINDTPIRTASHVSSLVRSMKHGLVMRRHRHMAFVSATPGTFGSRTGGRRR